MPGLPCELFSSPTAVLSSRASAFLGIPTLLPSLPFSAIPPLQCCPTPRWEVQGCGEGALSELQARQLCAGSACAAAATAAAQVLWPEQLCWIFCALFGSYSSFLALQPKLSSAFAVLTLVLRALGVALLARWLPMTRVPQWWTSPSFPGVEAGSEAEIADQTVLQAQGILELSLPGVKLVEQETASGHKGLREFFE